MRAEDFTDMELQKIRFHYSFQDMVKLFEGEFSVVQKYLVEKVVPSVSYLKKRSDLYLLSHLVRYGYGGMAKRFGVSQSFLKRLFRVVLHNVTVPFFEDSLSKIRYIDDITRSELESLIDISTVARIFKIKKKGNLSADAKMNSHIGRRGELIYKNFRGICIREDLNLSDPRSLYDFIDLDYGKVNVKTSNIMFYENGEKYWKVSLKANPQTDYYACVLLDGKKECFCILMMQYDLENKRKSRVIRNTDLSQYEVIYYAEDNEADSARL